MSSLGHALQAIALLKAVGYSDAALLDPGPDLGENTIAVSTDTSDVAMDVLRLVQADRPSRPTTELTALGQPQLGQSPAETGVDRHDRYRERQSRTQTTCVRVLTS